MSGNVKEKEGQGHSRKLRESYEAAEALIAMRRQFSGDALAKEMRAVLYAPRSGAGPETEEKRTEEELKAVADGCLRDAMRRNKRSDLTFAHYVTRIADAVRELWEDLPDGKRAQAEGSLVETLNGMWPAHEVLHRLAEIGRIPAKFASYPPSEEMTKEQRAEAVNEMEALLERQTLSNGAIVFEGKAEEWNGVPGDLKGFLANEARNPGRIFKILGMDSGVDKVSRKEQECIARQGLASALEKMSPEEKREAEAHLGRALEILASNVDTEKIAGELRFLNDYTGGRIGGSNLTGPKDSAAFKKMQRQE